MTVSGKFKTLHAQSVGSAFSTGRIVYTFDDCRTIHYPQTGYRYKMDWDISINGSLYIGQVHEGFRVYIRSVPDVGQ